MTREELIYAVAPLLHAGDRFGAAKHIAEFSGLPGKRVVTDDMALELCNSVLYWCLNNNRYDLAAEMLWGEQMFTYKPRCTQLVWDELQHSNSLMLMGAASQSKSFSVGVWLMLDWLRDPEYTSVNLVGPSEDHLKDNLFSHLVALHSQASLPLPGVVGDLFIGLDPKKRKGAIRGIVIPIGKKPAGRLQGRKRVPRKFPHPVLGPLSRMRIFIDEIEKVPLGIFKDLDNVFANLDTDIDGFKLICAFNPEDPEGQVAQRCEPQDGWDSFDPEVHERWTSKRGWRVLRLDAAKSENVVQKKVIFPGLQTYEGFNRIIENAGGLDTPGYWTMCRACFPRKGGVFSVISSLLLNRMRGEFLFAEEPVPCAGGDLSLEGNDPAVLATGRFGKVIGVRLPPSFERPEPEERLFRDANGSPQVRWGLQVDSLILLPRGDTVKMAEQIKVHCVALHIPPEYLMLDRTGNGAGVHDLLKSLWSEEVRGVNYSSGATEKKILEEDTKTAKEEYERAVSELWFAFKKWGEFNYVRIKPAALTEALSKQLTGRRYAPGKLTRVEEKKDYKSRGNNSPNDADAVTLLLHGVRMASGVIPSALTGELGSVVTGATGLHRGPVPCRVDITNEYEDLDADPESFYWN